MKLLDSLLDMLFPIRCLGCSAFDTWLCEQCTEQLPLLDEQHCFICKESQTSYGQKCPPCVKEEENKNIESHALDALLIASTYQDALLKKTIHYYKYRFITDLALPLASVLRQIIIHTPHFRAPDIIIPVPLHTRRLRWRGFNQAMLLTEALDVDIIIAQDILMRRRYTQPQMTLADRMHRLVNLDNAFVALNQNDVSGKTILLIDDITTTGATLEQCAKVLKSAGAKKVHGLVLARE